MPTSVSCGIVGLPNVGKSTLFNALTKNNVLAANYPFATIEPNTGIVAIHDDRLDELAKLYASKKIVPATVTFLDIAGLVAGASKGEGLGNQFLGHIRSTNVIIEVVRDFSDSQVIHVSQTINPKVDTDIINTELVLADLQIVERRLPRLEKEARANPKLKPELSALQQVYDTLNSGHLVNRDSSINLETISELQLITAKPIIYVFNTDEDRLQDKPHQQHLRDMVAPGKAVFICAKLENELKDLDPSDATELLTSYGQDESGLDQLIHTAYDQLGLQSFLTAGEKEVRAWTIHKGSTAPEAAGVIHTDFMRGFIAAEIVKYRDLIKRGSLAAARSQGLVRTEGKDYIMQPDDVVEFRFNV